MPWLLRSVRWWIGHLLVVALCITFVNLGFWQLARAEERRLENEVKAARFGAEPMALSDLMAGAGNDLDSLELRQATARGRFQPDHEVLVRSQVNDGVAGFHVVTPLLLADDSAVLVNRGWVPLEYDTVPSPAAPPGGEVEVSGWLLQGQQALSAAPSADDDPAIVSTVDIERLQTDTPWEIAPLYLVSSSGGGEGSFPLAVSPPDLTDQGPHALYALQWFAFTMTGAAGYVLLLRRALKSHLPPEPAQVP